MFDKSGGKRIKFIKYTNPSNLNKILLFFSRIIYKIKILNIQFYKKKKFHNIEIHNLLK